MPKNNQNNQNDDDIDDDQNLNDDQDDNNDDDSGDAGQDDGSGDDDSNDDAGKSGLDEDKLRKLGWVPKEEFKGDPDNWMDAETFQKKRTDELSTLRRELREAKQVITEFAEHSKTRDERAYKRALEELKAKKKAAVADGDIETFERIESEEQELRKDYEPPKKKPASDEQSLPPEVDEWIDANPWFLNDPELNAAATAFHGALSRSNPKLPLKENLKRTKENMQRMFPEKFKESKQTQSRSPALDGARLNAVRTGGGGKKKTAADLPEEARQAGARFVRQGLFKDLNEYAKDYFDQEQE